ncbi:MAG: RdgB/HAM1 family non-canonical purine NTP pyrophosphatase [Nitrospina sp.]|mgnify:FL=1|nr:RdgB/HAM1 family non-canonical purine NTP pyrophosphatase [Nitrospina sp.]|tara:strand:- start:7001 stop:7549 length:549 start_codon:yes stop_codon:yes gene_type:complete
MWKKLKFVTSNADKVREASCILESPLDQVSGLDIDEIQASDVRKVVAHKAQQAFDKLKCPVLVEDSGLSFTAWNGLPGALIKWFEISVGCQGLLKMLEGFENREAFAVCVAAIFDGQEMLLGEGKIRGKISLSIRGGNGFGWDVIFIPDHYEKTFAEMNFREKNAISHRRVAFEKLNMTIQK